MGLPILNTDMSPEQWQRARQIFAAATDKNPDERTRFLNEECAGDSELAHEVETLLAHHEAPNDLFTAPALGPAAWFSGQPPVALEGQRFGEYNVIREVGSGGMGVVYLAEDTRLHRDVALKLLPFWATQDESWVARFEQEALAASRLNHPNVPVVYEAGNIAGRHYIATEFVEGTTLVERIAAGPLPWRDALPIAIAVGKGLMAAHARGIIHRDVKPGNILLGKDGSVKLTDFGIAKLGEQVTQRLASLAAQPERPGLTSSGQVMGTPDFMSPEQAAGFPIDHRTDIWSLAMVLREMISGDPHTNEALRDSAHNHAVPAALRSVLRRGSENDRDQRFPTMAEFVSALEAVSSSARNSWSAILTSPRFWALSVVLLSVAAAVSWQMVMRTIRARETFKIGRIVKLTNSGNVAEAAVSAENRYLLYIVHENGEQAVRLRDMESGADRERLPAVGAGYTGITFARDGKSFYYLLDLHKNDERALYKAPLLEGSPVKLLDDVDSPIAVSPDGKRIEFERGYPDDHSSALFVAGADGSGERQFARRPYPAAFRLGGGAWVGGDSIVTAAYDGAGKVGLVQVNVASGTERQISPWSWTWIDRINWLASQRILVFSAAETNVGVHQIYQFSLANQTAHAIRPDLSNSNDAYASERNIVVVQEDLSSGISVAPVKGGGHPQRITPPAGRYRDVSWDPDGSLVASSGKGRELKLFRFFIDGSDRQITFGSGADWRPDVSPDGKLITFVSNGVGGRHIWICDRNGDSLRPVTSGPSTDDWPSFAPDGSIVYNEVLNGSQSIVKIGPAKGQRIIMAVGAHSPTVSPSGKYLACVMAPPNAPERWVVMDLSSGNVIAQFPNIAIDSPVRWAAGSSALLFTKTTNSVSNIFLESVTGGRERQLTHYEENVISSFDTSSDGQTFAMVRGLALSDAVLWENQP